MRKIIYIILTLATISCFGYAFADILISADNVSYNNFLLDKDNVKGALDDLLSSSQTTSSKYVSLNGGEPVIKDGLIPVILTDDGIVKEITSSDKTWYNYGEKKWANAVELVAGAKYHKGQSDERDYQVGDIIPESDIRSYFVWIPKYKYRLWNINSDGNSTGALKGVHSIEIEFDTTNTTNVEGVSCATPMTTNGTGQCNNGEWMTHPAFISMGVDGFWVGKFEIGNSLNTVAAATTAMTSSTASNIVIKPDYYSWTSTAAIDYFNLLKTYNTTLDSHMIKNTEWGAVAYLSHSKYGKDSEVNINNNYDASNGYAKTGYSSRPEMDQHTEPGSYGRETTYHTFWNTKNGYRASTTGNISGIYDMSGGSIEYVAGFRSGVSVTGDAKYYDSYNTSSNDKKDYKYRILGDATGEIGPFLTYTEGNGTERVHTWYGERFSFVTTSSPWFRRDVGGAYGSTAGLFAAVLGSGVASPGHGTHLVLSPKK